MTTPACPCGEPNLELLHTYTAPPAGEVQFDFGDTEGYLRELRRCPCCGHVISTHGMDTSALYGGAYVDATYGDAEGLRRRYETVIGLPPERSDNAGRVQRVVAYGGKRESGGSILDVGAGLCVFLHGMKRAGWTGTALDPDPRAAKHAREAVGVESVQADFLEDDLTGLGQFDAIALNKVLEHVVDPARMLARCHELLAPGGFVYVELPDVEAFVEGPGREEFFIDHWHVFSPASLALLVRSAGFRIDRLERLREPSLKYTLFAFLREPTRGER